MTNPDAIDFFTDPSLLVDPFPYFEALRARGPLQREPHHGVVMVTGYDEAVEIYNDTQTWSSCISVTGPFPGFPVPLVGRDISALIEEHRDKLPMSDQLPTLDPPVHTDHRSLLMRLITPKRLKENEDFMWRYADRLIDASLARGECDLIADLASPFTRLVIADLLGVPESDHARFAQALQQGQHAGGGVGGVGGEAMAHSPLEFLYHTFTSYVEDRRRSPREDVLGGLATATFPNGSLPSVLDVVRVAANVFAAGQETTVRLLGSAFKLIAEDAELQNRLRRDRSLIPNFIEETLRLESPVKGDFRLSRVATKVGGVELAPGTTVMLVNAAANRDPRRFENPQVFQVDRANARQHLAFGRGIHACPGAPLARAETRVCIERLLDRTSEIRISERAHGPAGARRYGYVPTFILRGLTHLQLEFSLAKAGAR
jgi:cytochrome P450